MSENNGPPIEKHACNFLQSIFAQFKVRLVVGISLGAEGAPVDVVEAAWSKALESIGAHAFVGLLTMPTQHSHDNQQSHPPPQARPILLRPEDIASVTKFVNQQPVVAGKGLRQLVNESLETTQPISGPARATLFVQDNLVFSLVVNISYALWDKTTLKTVVDSFLQRLSKNNDVESSKVPTNWKLGGWHAELIKRTPSLAEDEPNCLPMGDEGTTMTSMSQILPKKAEQQQQNSSRFLSFTFENDLVNQCEDVMKKKNNTNLIGLWMATLAYALAEAYFHANPTAPSVTFGQAFMMDVRPLLQGASDEKSGGADYLQMMGVVNMGRTFYAKEMGDKSTILAWLVKEAKTVLDDMSRRIQRGEVHRKALALATGRDLDNVECAVELSFHGRYKTTKADQHVQVGQRFDACQLMNVAVHTEEATDKTMYIALQLGAQQDRELTIQLFDRIKELWGVVAAEE